MNRKYMLINICKFLLEGKYLLILCIEKPTVSEKLNRY